MRKLNKLSGIFWLLLFGVFILACEKDERREPNAKGTIEFVINQTQLKNITSSEVKALKDIKKIIITIQTATNEATQYNSTELIVNSTGNNYYSQRIVLNVGEYQITEFLLLDGSNNTIYASPIEGSELAMHVFDPLPITFQVIKDVMTSVGIEVLNTENYVPGQFGLISFSISEIPIFNFALGIIDDISGETVSANLILKSGDYIVNKELDSVLNNIVVARDGFSIYSLDINKPGYIPVTHIYPIDSLKLFIDSLNNPLIIELSKIPEGSIIDIDRNVYNTVTIGDQDWMAENLRTTRFNDGTEIPLIEIDVQWEDRYAPAYCWYDNDSASYANVYGALYKWSVASSGNVCPDGWHVPSRLEWLALLNYLGTSPGGKLKEVDTLHWASPNLGAVNEYGFTALPGGYRHDEEGFYSLRGLGNWWSATEDPINSYWAYDFSITAGNDGASVDMSATARGEYIRCIKD